MNRSGALYIERDSFFHRLDGSVKLLVFVAWSAFVFLFMDARIFAALIGVGFVLLYLAKMPFRSVKPLVLFVIVFTLFNSLFLILITPEYGSQLAGRYTTAFHIGGLRFTWETLFFALTLSLKYLAILPVTLLFILTTHPSSFASSLNRLGVPYKVAYAVNIALRYIPDVTAEVAAIIQAQEARGVDFQKGDAGIWKRLKNYGTVKFHCFKALGKHCQIKVSLSHRQTVTDLIVVTQMQVRHMILNGIQHLKWRNIGS